MPIYEYLCLNCGHQMEALQHISEDPLTLCAQCGKNSLKKKVSAAGFQLKGSGWYATDFKDKKPEPKENNPAAETPKTNATPSPGTTSTAEEKP